MIFDLEVLVSQFGMADLTSLTEALDYALTSIGKTGIAIKDEQRRAIVKVFEGKDTFVWLPTGFGKSLCFECLPFVFDHALGRSHSSGERSVVLVISPLLSLMIEQVTSLRQRGVDAAILSGHDGVDKSLLAKDSDLGVPGKYSFVFSAPEAVVSCEKWRERLTKPPLHDRMVAVVVDEAHCVSKW